MQTTTHTPATNNQKLSIRLLAAGITPEQAIRKGVTLTKWSKIEGALIALDTLGGSAPKWSRFLDLSEEEKQKIVSALIENNVECRPLICGSMGTQPFYIKKYGRVELPNVSKIDKCGMYIPNFASSLIDANQLWDSKIKFKGVMIGNGVMLTNKYWRRQARNTFYSKHYFYGS